VTGEQPVGTTNDAVPTVLKICDPEEHAAVVTLHVVEKLPPAATVAW